MRDHVEDLRRQEQPVDDRRRHREVGQEAEQSHEDPRQDRAVRVPGRGQLAGAPAARSPRRRSRRRPRRGPSGASGSVDRVRGTSCQPPHAWTGGRGIRPGRSGGGPRRPRPGRAGRTRRRAEDDDRLGERLGPSRGRREHGRLDDVGHRPADPWSGSMRWWAARSARVQRWTLVPDVARPNLPSAGPNRRSAASAAGRPGRTRRGADRRPRTTRSSRGRGGSRRRRRRRPRPRRGRPSRSSARSASQPLPMPSRSNRRPAGRRTNAPRATPIERPRPRRPRRAGGGRRRGASVVRACPSASSRASRRPMSTIPPVRLSAAAPPVEDRGERRTDRHDRPADRG